MVKTMTESLSILHMRYADEISMNAVLVMLQQESKQLLSMLSFAISIKAASF
jgi:hypothetical protein